MGRLREMEQDDLLLRNNYGGLPRRVEYELTDRGRRLIPLLDALLKTGIAMECNDCQDRKDSAGYYCDFCPEHAGRAESLGEHREVFIEPTESSEVTEPLQPVRRPKDDSIVLL